MKMAVDKKLRSTQSWRQVIFPPEILTSACKNRFRMSPIRAQFSAQPDDAVNVGTRAVFPSFAFERTHRLACKVFD